VQNKGEERRPQTERKEQHAEKGNNKFVKRTRNWAKGAANWEMKQRTEKKKQTKEESNKLRKGTDKLRKETTNWEKGITNLEGKQQT
jgi:ABC-type transport system involved in cytochrome bd biosynthesis fused ATPase/permease subunit